MKDKRLGSVYFISDCNANIKIGFSNNISRRIKELNVASANKLTLIYSIENVTMDYEKTLHDYFGSQYNERGEFYDSEAVMRWINQYKLNIKIQLEEGII